MKRSLLVLCTLGSLLSAPAQLEKLQYEKRSTTLPEWVRLMYAEDPDPAAVEAAYKAYYAQHPFVKNGFTQYYKRWRRELGRELVPKAPQLREGYYQDLRTYQEATEELAGSRAANWSCIGPIDWDHGSISRSYAAGSAHVYTVEKSATNDMLLYAGTATAGLWKTTDKGLNWTNVTKHMMVGSIISVEIDHSTGNTVYFGAEGDLFKTIDGGATWNSIGDAVFQSASHSIRDIVMHPTDPQMLFVCSNQGLYRTSNGGASFIQVQAGSWQEVELKPDDPSKIYAVKQISNRTEFWRSTDGGLSFLQVGTGWPLPVDPDEQERTEIAVSPAAPNTVYALCTGAANGGSGLYGVYVSTDQGITWTFRCCGAGPAGVASPTNLNLMGWDDAGQDDGGQYYYDLSFAVDPANANKLMVGGVNRWVSTDGGITFTCPAKWSHSYKVDYVHADIHDIRYYGTNEVWVANDGGIFYSSDGGASFERRMFGIAGTDFWGFGVGGWTGSQVMLGGAYHNGTMLKDNNVYTNGWVCTDGGDGVRGFVHPQYDRRALSDYGYKVLSGDRLVNNVNGAWDKEPNASYITGENSDVVWHPNLVNTAFVGSGNGLWRTDDNGSSFNLVHDFGVKVTSLDVAFSDPNTLYVCTYPGWWDAKQVWRTVDGGATWTNITPTSAQLNGNTWVPYDVAVSGADPQVLWLLRTSQYGNSPNLNGNSTYKSTDGGTTWANITDANLNGEWPTNITHQLGSNGGVYIGTRRGVYLRTDDAPTWTLWNAGLPARLYSTRLLINYREGLIRNGTDRSVWESALETLAPPLANFSANKRTVTCLAPAVQFYDNSALNGTGATWNWSFPGGSPSTSASRTPLVTYSAVGTYTVSLTVTDANGTHTRSMPGFITVDGTGTATPLTANAEDQFLLPSGWTGENPDQLDTWTNQALTVGADGNATRAWRIDYYYYNAPGQVDRLVTPLITLGGSAGTRLRFHHAYKPYGASYTDGLRVEISTTCGASWTQLYYAEAAALGTTTTGTSPWAPTAAAQWLLHDIDLSAYDGQQVVIRFTGVNDFGDRLYLDNITVTNSGMRLAVKLLLEGPFDVGDGLMQDDLRQAGSIPAAEPYTGLGYAHTSDGGGEVMQAGVVGKTGDNAIVDWVVVELRNALVPTSVVATRAALVQRDGDVVAEDGVSPISLLAGVASYYVSLKHRNHLGVMTASPVSLSTATTLLDFSVPALATYGLDARHASGGRMFLWPGDANVNRVVSYTGSLNDRDVILQAIGGIIPTATILGVNDVRDVNLDGVISYTGAGNDRDLILRAIGGVVPTVVRTEQLR